VNKKQIPVEELRLGMYVAELDRPWLGTPFEYQGFHLISAYQIDDLKKHCKTVFIDLDNELSNNPHEGHGVAKSSLRVSADADIELGWSTDNHPRYLELTPVEKELSVAKEVYSACEEGVQASLETMRLEGDWDPKPVKNAVDSMTKSIERNPDAMMLLFRIKQKIGQEFNRAVDTSIHMITFGRFLQLPDEQLQLLGLAGLFLDIGKVKLPDTILQKKSALTAEEYEFVKTHVMHSVELIRAAPGLPKGLEDIVVQHHERLDGSGYPRGLRGRQITLDGAIAGLVDSYSAITSTRPYAEQSSPSAALNQLYKLRGKLFDEALVEQFIQCIGIYPVGSAVELNTGEIAIVITQNLARRLQPRVMLILDRYLKPTPQVILDLAKEPQATPDEPYRIRRTFPRDKLPIDFGKFLT
jgi:HD-GYP domain-containing protein (c-di-GMP phosphodiesterase class II)